MKDETKTLNLDELFGNSTRLSVVLDGVKYYLNPIDSLGALGASRLEAMSKETGKAMAGKDLHNLTPDDAAQVEGAVTEIIRIISPELAGKGLGFIKSFSVIQFYLEEQQKETAAVTPEGDAAAPRPPSIGGNSSPGSHSGTGSRSQTWRKPRSRR